MRTFKLLLIALVICLSLPAAAQLTDTYVIPAAAKRDGANNTRWLTQLSLFNPHLDHTLTVSVIFMRTGVNQGIERQIELPANTTYLTDDVLGEVFNTTGTGSILAVAFSEDNPDAGEEAVDLAFLINSYTYNNAATGTYGQTIPAVWSGLLDYDFDQISAVAHGIDNSSRLGFRTNVGAANLGKCSVTLLVSAYDADGKPVLVEAPFIIPPTSHLQGELPVQLEGGSVEFFVSDPCVADDDKYAVVFPYTSTVDNISGDPKYQWPSLLASPSVVFGKKAQKAVDLTQLGKKIDAAYARTVRAQALRLGKAHLVRGDRRWVIAK